MEKKVVKAIEKIIEGGGIVTIDLNIGEYIPAPVRELAKCNCTIKLDSNIDMKKLLKNLYEDPKLEVVRIREDVYIIGKRGTSIVVYKY